MLRELRPPWIYVAQFLSFAVVLIGILQVAAMIMAVPIAELDLGGKSLPGSWEAAVESHRRYFEGFLIRNHPVRFGVWLLVLIGGGIAVQSVERAIRQQIEIGSDPREEPHQGMRKWFLFVLLAIAIICGRLFSTLPT